MKTFKIPMPPLPRQSPSRVSKERKRERERVFTLTSFLEQDGHFGRDHLNVGVHLCDFFDPREGERLVFEIVFVVLGNLQRVVPETVDSSRIVRKECTPSEEKGIELLTLAYWQQREREPESGE